MLCSVSVKLQPLLESAKSVCWNGRVGMCVNVSPIGWKIVRSVLCDQHLANQWVSGWVSLVMITREVPEQHSAPHGIVANTLVQELHHASVLAASVLVVDLWGVC